MNLPRRDTLSFTVSQVLQLIMLLAAGFAAWGNLSNKMEAIATEVRIANRDLERRVTALENERSRREEPHRRSRDRLGDQ